MDRNEGIRQFSMGPQFNYNILFVRHNLVVLETFSYDTHQSQLTD